MARYEHLPIYKVHARRRGHSMASGQVVFSRSDSQALRTEPSGRRCARALGPLCTFASTSPGGRERRARRQGLHGVNRTGRKDVVRRLVHRLGLVAALVVDPDQSVRARAQEFLEQELERR
jgi:hypothetical protein